MISGTEVLQLAIAAVMAPIIIFSLRHISMPSKRYIAAALVALTFSHIFTILEGFAAHDLFDMLEHALLALSGVMFAMSAWVGAKYWHHREGAT